MRVSRIAKTIILAVTALVAGAAFERVSLAYEVSTRNFTAPATQNGGVVIRRCDNCSLQSIRVTASTTYTLDGEMLSLEKFKDALVLSNGDAVTLTVLHHLESDTVLRVSATTVRNYTR